MKTSETLNLAADLIQQRGWMQGAGWPGTADGNGEHRTSLCLEGGIMAALGLEIDLLHAGGAYFEFKGCPAYLAVKDHLAERGESGFVFAWNDERDRTESEVIEVLRAAAAIEQAREDQDAAFATYAANVAQIGASA